jgi:hypothetical protein
MSNTGPIKLIDYTRERRPVVSTAFAALAIPFGLFSVLGPMEYVWKVVPDSLTRPQARALGGLVLILGALMGLWAWAGWRHAARTSFLVIDRELRRLHRRYLNNAMDKTDSHVSFDEVKALKLVRSDFITEYRSSGGGHRGESREPIFHVIALPTEANLFTARSLGEAERVAKKVAGVVGVPFTPGA